MENELSALFYSTDVINWKTSYYQTLITDINQPILNAVNNNNFIWKYFSQDHLLQKFTNLKSSNYSWHINLSPNEEYFVIVKNNSIELRTNVEYTKLFETPIIKNIQPQWTTVTWSDDSLYYLISFANGNGLLLDAENNECHMSIKNHISKNFDIIIKTVIKSISKDKLKIIFITLKRHVFVFSVSNMKVISSSDSGQIDCFDTPILCAQANKLGNYIVFGTYNQQGNFDKNPELKKGLVLCRVFDEAPYFTNVYNMKTNSSSNSVSSYFRNSASDGVYLMNLSPDNESLVVVMLSGDCSLYSFPSLKCKFTISHHSLKISNDLISNDYLKGKILPLDYASTSINDVCWWNKEYIVVALKNGRIILINTDNSIQLDKKYLCTHPFPKLNGSSKQQFLQLSCVSKSQNSQLIPKSRDLINSNSLGISWTPFKLYSYLTFYFGLDRSIETLKREDFLCPQSYKLSTFKLTTSEELFNIKLELKQFTEALELAEKYNLDKDLVYEKQWKDSEMNLEDIENSLIKISKRNWILNECLERIPKTKNSFKLLLNLGIQLTDFKYFKFPIENNDVDIKLDLARKSYREIVEEDELNDLDIKELSINQYEILRVRYKLLGYLDKLKVYEQILFGEKKHFDCDYFQTIKSSTSFDMALYYARNGDISSLKIVMDFYREELNNYLLIIFDNLPECIEPDLYVDLLKQFLDYGLLANSNKELDWCENALFVTVCSQISSISSAIDDYIKCDSSASEIIVKDFKDDLKPLLKLWLERRIRNIENYTLNTGFSLDLLEFSRNQLQIELDPQLEFHIRYLYESVFTCQIQNQFLSLEQFEETSHLNKAKLLISNAEHGLFINHFDKWLIPFFTHIKQNNDPNELNELIRDFIKEISRFNLTKIQQILQDKSTMDKLCNFIDLMELYVAFLETIFTNDNPDDLEECSAILFLLNQVMHDQKKLHQVHNHIQLLEKYITVLKILEKYNCKQSFKFIHENRMDEEVVEHFLMNMLVRYLNSVKSLTKQDIQLLVADLEICVSLVFKCLHVKLLYKNIVKILLESAETKKMCLVEDFVCLNCRLSKLNDAKARTKLLDFQETVECIVDSVQRYIDSSVSSKDQNINSALFCLNLLKDHTPATEKQLELIKCCEILEIYKCPVIPIELRNMVDRSELLLQCLKANDELYSNIKELSYIGLYLCDTKQSDKKYRKGEALRMGLNHAFQLANYKVVGEMITLLIEMNHKPCWKECLKLMKTPEFPMSSKYNIGKYAVAYCPDSHLIETLSCINSIKLSSYSWTLTSSGTSNNTTDGKSTDKQVSSFLNSNSSNVSLLSLGSDLMNLTRDVIDRSSDTLGKLTNLALDKANKTQLYKQNTNNDNANNNNSNNQSRLHLIYDREGRFDESCSEIQLLWQALEFTVNTTDTQSQQLHLKLIRHNLLTDQLMCLLHALCVQDATELVKLRLDFPVITSSNLALVYYLLACNFVARYNPSRFQLRHLLNINGALNNLLEETVQSNADAKELKLLDSVEQQLKDYLLLEQVHSLHQFDLSRFLASVDYRKKTIVRLGEFNMKSPELFSLACELGQRYKLPSYQLYWKYFVSFVNEYSQEKLKVFVENLEKDAKLLTDSEKFPGDVEEIIRKTPREHSLDLVKLLLEILTVIDGNQVELFGKSVDQHNQLMELFNSIFDLGGCGIYYVDFLLVNIDVIISSIHEIVSVDNLNDCERLMASFDLSEQFTRIKTDFSSVIANQIMWSNNTISMESNSSNAELQQQQQLSSLQQRFSKSLTTFEYEDDGKFQDFVYKTLFEHTNKMYISPKEKLELIEVAEIFVGKLIDSNSSDSKVKNWNKVRLEISIWRDHLENSMVNVKQQLNNLPSISDELKLIVEYLSPDNFWSKMLMELLLGKIELEDMFTLVWELSIDDCIVAEALLGYLNGLMNSRFVSSVEFMERVDQVVKESLEYWNVQALMDLVLDLVESIDVDNNNNNSSQSDAVFDLLMKYQSVKLQGNIEQSDAIRLSPLIVKCLVKWKLLINAGKLELNKNTSLGLVNSWLGDLPGGNPHELTNQMKLVVRAIQLVELVCVEDMLWQCWIKSCVIQNESGQLNGLVFDVMWRLRYNKSVVYSTDRFNRLCKIAIHSLTAFKPAEAISLMILADPVHNVDRIQVLLESVRADSNDFPTTMKSIEHRSLSIIVRDNHVALYARTILFQRLVNYLTNDLTAATFTSADIDRVVDDLRRNNFNNEADWLVSCAANSSSSNQINNPATRTIGMVSGLWKKFAGNY